MATASSSSSATPRRSSNNYIVGNTLTGIWGYDSGNMDIWNNTLVGNGRSLSFWTDSRSGTGPSTTTPWITRNINVHDNVVVYGGDFCPILTQDLTLKWSGADFGVTMDGNVYHRTSPTSPSRFACWANGAAGTKAFNDLGTFTTATGNDKRSKLYEGTSIVTSAMALTSTVRTATSNVPLPLPSLVAALIGQSSGEATLGAYDPMRD